MSSSGPVSKLRNTFNAVGRTFHGRSMSETLDTAFKEGSKKKKETYAGGINPGDITPAQQSAIAAGGAAEIIRTMGGTPPPAATEMPVADAEAIKNARRRYAARMLAGSSGRASTILTNQGDKLGAG